MTTLKALFALLALWTPALALAAEDQKEGSAPTAEKEAVAPDQIVDLKPQFGFSENVSGEFGLAFGAEKKLGEKWYLTGELSAWMLERSTDDVKDEQADQDDDDDDLIAKRRRASAALVGARRYAKPAEDTWYVGGKTGVMRTNSIYVVDDSEIQDKATGIPLLIEAGYRWIWESGLVIRVGGRGGKTALLQREIDTTRGEESDRSERKVRKEDPEFSQSFDFAVGYAF